MDNVLFAVSQKHEQNVESILKQEYTLYGTAYDKRVSDEIVYFTFTVDDWLNPETDLPNLIESYIEHALDEDENALIIQTDNNSLIVSGDTKAMCINVKTEIETK